MTLLIASQNQGKIKEFKKILNDWDIVIPDTDLDVEETGTTFEENARLKAKAFAEKFPDRIAIADDSGLVVDALHGRPGVYSKRYGKTDRDRNTKLLKEMDGMKNRTAKFVACICLYGQGIDECFTGEVTGSITEKMKGDNGFGYDPIFIPDGYDQTFAELGTEQKNTMSHRGRALEKVKEFLETSM